MTFFLGEGEREREKNVLFEMINNLQRNWFPHIDLIWASFFPFLVEIIWC